MIETVAEDLELKRDLYDRIEAVVGVRTVIASNSDVSNISFRSAGTHMETNPAPDRKAPWPLKMAAPVLPREPATISRWPKVPLWVSFCRLGSHLPVS